MAGIDEREYERAVLLLRDAHKRGETQASLFRLFAELPIAQKTLKTLLLGGNKIKGMKGATKRAAIAAARRLQARDCTDCRIYDAQHATLAGPFGEGSRLDHYFGLYTSFLRDPSTGRVRSYKCAIEPCQVCGRPTFWVSRRPKERRRGHIYLLHDRLYLLMLERSYARLAILRRVADPTHEPIVGILLYEEDQRVHQPIAGKVVFLHERGGLHGSRAVREAARLIYNETSASGVLRGWSREPADDDAH